MAATCMLRGRQILNAMPLVVLSLATWHILASSVDPPCPYWPQLHAALPYMGRQLNDGSPRVNSFALDQTLCLPNSVTQSQVCPLP